MFIFGMLAGIIIGAIFYEFFRPRIIDGWMAILGLINRGKNEETTEETPENPEEKQG